jgi:hypothetical protein
MSWCNTAATQPTEPTTSTTAQSMHLPAVCGRPLGGPVGRGVGPCTALAAAAPNPIPSSLTLTCHPIS